jgi:hypothetical protein
VRESLFEKSFRRGEIFFIESSFRLQEFGRPRLLDCHPLMPYCLPGILAKAPAREKA